MNIDRERHDEIDQEIYEIASDESSFRKVFWVALVIGFLAHLCALTLIVFLARWMLPEVNRETMAIIVSVAYACALVLVCIERVYQKLRRMEMHALTMRDLLLTIQEKQNP